MNAFLPCSYMKFYEISQFSKTIFFLEIKNVGFYDIFK